MGEIQASPNLLYSDYSCLPTSNRPLKAHGQLAYVEASQQDSEIRQWETTGEEGPVWVSMGTSMAQHPNTLKTLASTSRTKSPLQLLHTFALHIFQQPINFPHQGVWVATLHCHSPFQRISLYWRFTGDPLHINDKNYKPQSKTTPKQFWATLKKSAHLNGDPFRLVPVSISTM